MKIAVAEIIFLVPVNHLLPASSRQGRSAYKTLVQIKTTGKRTDQVIGRGRFASNKSLKDLINNIAIESSYSVAVSRHVCWVIRNLCAKGNNLLFLFHE